jgi:hypothetical protein
MAAICGGRHFLKGIRNSKFEIRAVNFIALILNLEWGKRVAEIKFEREKEQKPSREIDRTPGLC